MMTNHLESSARARPAELATTGARDDDLRAMLSHRPVGAEDVVMPEHALRNLLADLDANEPYVVTHGSVRADYNERRAALERALERMENS